MLINRKLNKKYRNEKGAVITEFAIVLPLLLLLLFGFIEFGVLMYNKQVIINASREGARAAINPLPVKLTELEVKEIVMDYCQKLITFGNNPDALDTIVIGAEGDFETDVTVSVTYEYGFLVPSIIRLGPTINLSSQTIMKMM